jgi:hypothetical protein
MYLGRKSDDFNAAIMEITLVTELDPKDNVAFAFPKTSSYSASPSHNALNSSIASIYVPFLAHDGTRPNCGIITVPFIPILSVEFIVIISEALSTFLGFPQYTEWKTVFP